MAGLTHQNSVPADILDDLSSRFLINLPEEECNDPVRLFFQIELAHWYYLDFYHEENPQLPRCGMKEFTRQILKHIPIYTQFLNDLSYYYEEWRGYKLSVPTYGAVLMNEDMTKVLLVQSYFEKTSWGFPKGKVNFEENPAKCAVREVFEETGFDIQNLINENEFIESSWVGQMVRLYMVPGVKETEKFVPQTRNEIKYVEWFSLSDLPTCKKDLTPKLKLGVNTNSFFMVLPFVKRIRKWVTEKKAEMLMQPANRRRKRRNKSVGDLNPASPTPSNLVHSKSILNSEDVEAVFQNLSVAGTLPPKNHHRTNSDSRRQLFREKKNTTNTIIVPCWLNFKLNKEPLLRCFDI